MSRYIAKFRTADGRTVEYPHWDTRVLDAIGCARDIRDAGWPEAWVETEQGDVLVRFTPDGGQIPESLTSILYGAAGQNSLQTQ